MRELQDEEIIKKEYKEWMLKLENVQRWKNKKVPLYVGVLSIFSFSLSSTLMYYNNANYKGRMGNYLFAVAASIFLGICMSVYVRVWIEIREGNIRRKLLEYEIDDAQDELEEDIFENSVKMSYKYLDQYYLQTREQAQRGFFVTICVAIFGAFLIGVGVIAMLLGKTNPSYVTCASGVITEFISAIFFYLYNKTITSMSKYHNKLVLSQNISIALKVADTLPDDDKVKSKNTIINELLKDVNSYLIKSDAENRKNE